MREESCGEGWRGFYFIYAEGQKVYFCKGGGPVWIDVREGGAEGGGWSAESDDAFAAVWVNGVELNDASVN